MKPPRWTAHDEDLLCQHYASMPLEALVILLNRSDKAIRTRARRLGLGQCNFWSAADHAVFMAEYPTSDTAALAAKLRRTEKAIHQRAKTHGLRKTPETRERIQARINVTFREAGQRTRFQAGHATWNAGMKGYSAPGTEASRFQPGQKPHNTQPLGTERCNNGYLERKVSESGPSRFNFRPVHRLIWEEAHGPIPEGWAVVFKNGDRTDFRLENLEMISRAELAARNHFKRYPLELRRLIGQKAWLTRVINQRTKEQTP